VKSDRKDAELLARLSLAGSLTARSFVKPARFERMRGYVASTGPSSAARSESVRRLGHLIARS
jgi:hypothetical protein